MKKNKKTAIKNKIFSILKSYKTIIYISFFINIVLLFFSYNIMSNNHQYTFEGSDEYIRVNDGLIVLNNDLNLIYGNDIEYINEKDIEVVSLELGYYLIDNKDNLKVLLNDSFIFEESMSLKKVINNFINFNIIEKNNNKSIFTNENVKLLHNGIYFILRAKTIDGEDINCKINLNVIKISKF